MKKNVCADHPNAEMVTVSETCIEEQIHGRSEPAAVTLGRLGGKASGQVKSEAKVLASRLRDARHRRGVIVTTLRAGQIVKYANPEAGEEHLTFVLLEDRGDRVAIQSRDFPDWRFKPVSVVATTEIVVVQE